MNINIYYDGLLIGDNIWSDAKILFNHYKKCASIGLFISEKSGTFHVNCYPDKNYKNKKTIEGIDHWSTPFYAGYCFNRFDLFCKNLKNYIDKIIGQKVNLIYNEQGFKTFRIDPGHVIDQSMFDLDNPKYQEYYKKIWEYKGNYGVFLKTMKRRKNKK